MFLGKANSKKFKIGLGWLVSLIVLFSFVMPLPVMAENGDAGQSSITVNLRATGLAGDIFHVEAFEVPPGDITVNGITLDRQTALGAVAAYVYGQGINIEITEEDFGLYLVQIGDNENDVNKWGYYVNESSPWVSAADYELADGDTVHFANYALNLYTLSLALDKEEMAPGDNITATVQYTGGDGNTVPASGAAVYVSAELDNWGSPVPSETYVGETGADGTLTFTWDEAGIFYPYAEWNAKSTLYQWPVASFSVGKRISVPQQDNNWVKNGNTVLDALLAFQQADGSFWWGKDSAGAVKSATVDSLAALVDLACGESARHRLGKAAHQFSPGQEKLAAAISKTIAWYRENHNPPNSWIGMPALWAAGEDLNSAPWSATQSWRETDPGFAADSRGNEHIEYIFRLLSVGLDPAGVWGRNLYAELSAQQDSESGSFGDLGKHIWAIVALDVGKGLGKDVGGWDNAENRQKAVNYLLEQQGQDGSFGEFSQLDFTGWSLIALSNYMAEANVKNAVDKAVAFLRSRQQSTGGFAMAGPWGVENANSNAAVISGLVAAGEELLPEDFSVAVEDADTPLEIDLPRGAASANIKTAPTQAGEKKTATLPSIVVTVQTDLGAAPVKVEIPQGTVVSGPAGWDGTIKLPELKEPGSVKVPGASVSAVIEVGLPEGQLDFNRPVRLLLPGQAGKLAGFIRDGADFTEINKELSDDSLAAASAELSPGEAGKIDVGDDLVIWTTHFTRFVAYTPGGGDPTSGNGGDLPSTITVTVQVIGKNTTYFSGSLSLPTSQANALEALRATGLSVYTRYDDNYIYRIEDEEEDLATTSGWKYKVNGIVPDTPAKTYSVSQGDHIVWFWAADAEATGPGAGTNQAPATPLTPLGEEEFLEMITALRELLAELHREKGEAVPLEAETERIEVKVIGAEEFTEETKKAALRALLQSNIVSISRPVDPREDTLVSDSDIAEILLHVEAGSLSASTEITVEEISAAGLPAAPNYTPVFSAYRLGPKGTVFTRSVLLLIRLALPDDLDPDGLVLAWLDEEEGQWYALPAAIDLTRGYICALVDHFTPFAVLAREEAPEAGDDVPVFNDVTMENYPWAYEAIQSLARQKILHGVGDGKFAPERPVTRAEFVTMLVNALGLEPEKEQEPPFVDIEPEAWYGNAVKAAVEAGLVKGVSETAFQPNGTITREQMAVILSRTELLAGREAKRATAFTDAGKISPWAAEGVRRVVFCGLLQGFPDGRLQPQGEVSRAQAAVVFYRLLME